MERIDHPVKDFFRKPLGELLFRARLLRIDFEASRQANREMWSSSDQARRIRQGEIYAQRRSALVNETIEKGEGSQRFLAKLAMEDGELHEEPGLLDFEVPDYPDFSEAAGYHD